jgi:tRNA threonylcarbamoyladenosine modification (KEOPS) complex  Pcc1 subunit
LENNWQVKQLEAKIILEYKTSKTASAIAHAISPDNFSAPSNLFIKTIRKNTQVLTEMKTEENLSTLIATIDDLLFCVSTAEKTLQVLKEK